MTNYDRVVEELRKEGYDVSEENSGWSFLITKTGYETSVSSVGQLEAFLRGVQIGAACG